MEEGGPEEMAPTVSSREDYETEHHVVSVVEAAVREDWKEVLSFLANKESEALPLLVADREGGNLHLRTAREAEVEWVVLSSARHGFSTVTAVLAMSYFDWCFLPCADGRRGPLMRIQGDKPWMGRLAAVVCMSLAIKVEETSVPLLLDLQVPPPLPVAVSSTEESGFLFEPMIVRRMELLVLSSLEWKMNPVTPLSFIHHLLPRLYSGGGFAARIRELAKRSGEALLYVIAGGLGMSSTSGIGVGGGGSAPRDGVARGLPPHFSPQTLQGKPGTMLPSNGGIHERHQCDWPQAQAFFSLIAGESPWSGRFLLQQRELVRIMVVMASP
ncbi:uncharacterized protein LOC121972777 [Zingiber officinale]|uniref:uncharacterized protein LOC121972777 n=1 Tax=Zingiber officinale TaxID=94328 RepID=UPI001C4DB7F6|nr:uncharacterized protein LOC121972777 [Zingiber officinale]